MANTIAEVNLQKDIEKFLKTAAIAYAEKGADLLTNKAKEVIDYFYDQDYPSPIVYHRTGNLRKRSYKRYYKNNGSRVYGGVVVSSERMHENYGETTPASRVFQLGYVGGYHGVPGAVPPMRPSPLALLRRYLKSREFIDEAYDYAIREAKNQKYIFF